MGGNAMTQYDYRIAKAKVRMAYEEADRLIESYYNDNEMKRIKYRSGRIVIKYKDPAKDTVTIFDDPEETYNPDYEENMVNLSKKHLGFWSEI